MKRKIIVWVIVLLLVSNMWIFAFDFQQVIAATQPRAEFFWSPTSPEVNVEIVFDGSPSTPNGGVITVWVWNFGDGNFSMSYVPIVTHTYNSPGFYTVMLNVTDSEEQVGVRSKSLSVTLSRSTMVVAYSSSPTTLDPARCEFVSEIELLFNVYEGLVFFDREKTNQFVQRLATDWEISQDGLTYTFYIRQGVRFHNDALLTTEDVEYSFERLLVIEGFAAYMFYEALFDVLGSRDAVGNFTVTGEQIDNAITITDETVMFHLAKPYPPFLQILSQCCSSILSKAWCIEIGDWPQSWNNWTLYNKPFLTAIELQDTEPPGPHLNAMCGTGPFMLDYCQTGTEWSIIKFDNYWNGWPAPDSKDFLQRITGKRITDWGTRKTMFLQGQLDHIEVPPTKVDEVLGQPGISCTYPLESLSCYAMFFTFDIATYSLFMGVPGGLPPNTFNESGIPPDFFSDINVRKGFAYAFNYTKLIEEELRGEATQPATPVVPGMPFYNSGQEKYSTNLETAGTCFATAWNGSLAANGFNFTICYVEGSLIQEKACEIIKANVESLNSLFHIQIQPLPWINFTSCAQYHELPMFLCGWAPFFADPHDSMLGFVYSEGFFPQWQAYSHTWGDALVQAGISTTNETSRRLIYYELQELYHQICPSFPLYQPTYWRFEWDWVQGWYYNPLLCMANYFYIQWKETVPASRYSWPMFHHDLKHTGYSESPAPNTNQTLWNYTTGANVMSSPAIADGKVYVGSYDSRVYCLDALTGAHIWNYTTGNSTHSSPAIADGRIYIGSRDSKIYCLDATTGAHIWNYTTGNDVTSSSAVADGKVYIGSWDGKVYCLNALNGAHIWNYTTGDRMSSSPAISDGKVYVGSADGKVYCLNAATGARTWNYTTGDIVVSSPAIADGRIYIGSRDSKIYCLDATTGAHIWNYTTGDYVDSSPAIADGKVYVGSADGKVYCLNAATGARTWNYTTGDIVDSSPAIADGKVYVGSYDSRVYCLDALTGAHIWNYTTGQLVVSGPAIADGIVFVGSCDSKVYAFGNIIRVPEDYATIQGAINAATPGATIIVAPGIYNETLVVNKNVTIIGQVGSSAIFCGGGSGTAVTLLPGASGSIIAGIVMTNWDQGIVIVDSSNCKIYDNIMYLMNLNGISVQGNAAANNQIYSNMFQEQCGIAVNLSATSNTVYKNIIKLSDIGINLGSNGNTIRANTIIENGIGINMSNSNGNIIYHNNFVDNADQITISANAGNTWDDGYPSGGNYWSNYAGVDIKTGPGQSQDGSDGIFDSEYTIAVNNVDNYPLVQPFNRHDIGISNIIPSKTIVGQGFNVRIEVNILNYGIYSETFTVTLCANTRMLAEQTIELTSRNFTTVTFTWNTQGFDIGEYSIKAEADTVPDETDTLDNVFIDGTLFVGIPGDVDANNFVEVKDLLAVALAYGSYPGHPKYNPNLDVNSDEFIDVKDILIAALNYGQHYP